VGGGWSDGMRVVIHKNGMCRNLVVNRTWGWFA